MNVEIPLEDWVVQFARFGGFHRDRPPTVIYKDSDKQDLNKGRAAEKLIEVLGMSPPTAIAVACCVTCASRDLSRILRHVAPRDDNNEVTAADVVERFSYDRCLPR